MVVAGHWLQQCSAVQETGSRSVVQINQRCASLDSTDWEASQRSHRPPYTQWGECIDDMQGCRPNCPPALNNVP